MAAGAPGSVLFACTNNVIRSPMAEGIARLLFGDRIYVTSVGIRTGGEPDHFAIEAMDELGIDMAKHEARSFDELQDTSFDLVISLSPEARAKVAEFTRTIAADTEHWPLPDPSMVEGSREVRMNAYRSVRDDLVMRIKKRLGASNAPVV